MLKTAISTAKGRVVGPYSMGVAPVYEGHVSDPHPAGSTVAVATLPMDAKVEIGMIAVRPTVSPQEVSRVS